MVAWLTLLLGLIGQQSQPPQRLLDPTLINPTPGDVRMNQFADIRGANWKVFAVNAFPEGPIVINQVEEVKQQNPPSTWGIYFGNRELHTVNTLTMAAAVVDVGGNVKATQLLPAIKNLKPQQVLRKEVRIRVTVLAPTDRVVFFLKELKSESEDWRAADADVAALIKAAAARFPVP